MPIRFLRRTYWRAYDFAISAKKRATQLVEARHARGNEVYCPCCGRTFSHFLDYPAKLGRYYTAESVRGTLCPYCRSVGRHRILCDYWDKHLPDAATPKAARLVFAPERSITTWFKRHKLPYTTSDLFEPGVDLKLDLNDIALPDASIHLAVCNHVLEHVPDYRRSLAELYRVLAPGGQLVLSVPGLETLATTYEDASVVTPEDRELHFAQSDHLRLFGEDFPDIVARIGFTVSVVDGKDTDPRLHANFRGPALTDSTKIFICTK